MDQSARRAIEVLEDAIGEIRDGHDALPTIDLACTLLRIGMGEVPASELVDIEDFYLFDCDEITEHQ